ncbi:MAG: hypothetical protein M3Y22_15295 [Pseudomonadota bacterium]|nr:hypothetical protein [Pseudomonadota bacterium]
MMRVQYTPVAGRIAHYCACWLVTGHDPILVGYTYTLSTGRWIARPRSASAAEAVAGWRTRTDAARWMLIQGKFAQEPEAFRLEVAA